MSAHRVPPPCLCRLRALFAVISVFARVLHGLLSHVGLAVFSASAGSQPEGKHAKPEKAGKPGHGKTAEQSGAQTITAAAAPEPADSDSRLSAPIAATGATRTTGSVDLEAPAMGDGSPDAKTGTIGAAPALKPAGDGRCEGCDCMT